MMMEADISLGFDLEGSLTEMVPIMAHPPLIFSDLSLNRFLETIITVSTKVWRVQKQFLQAMHFLSLQTLEENPQLRKGIKLDFKRTDILETSLEKVQSLLDRINFPLWINADIINGPGLLKFNKKVNPNVFLDLVKTLVPEATISPGFTTSALANPPMYEQGQIDEMVEQLHIHQCFGLKITFPIRGMFAGMFAINSKINP